MMPAARRELRRQLERSVNRRREQLMTDFDDLADDNYMGYPEMLDIIKAEQPEHFDDYQDWITA